LGILYNVIILLCEFSRLSDLTFKLTIRFFKAHFSYMPGSASLAPSSPSSSCRRHGENR